MFPDLGIDVKIPLKIFSSSAANAGGPSKPLSVPVVKWRVLGFKGFRVLGLRVEG